MDSVVRAAEKLYRSERAASAHMEPFAWWPSLFSANLKAAIAHDQVPEGLRLLTNHQMDVEKRLRRLRLRHDSDGRQGRCRADDGSRQVERVVSIVVTANGTVTQPPRSTITADDPNGFVLHATFVETSRFDLPDVNIALLYWRETTGAQVLARGVLFRWQQLMDGTS
jgi:hypothetical protein